MRSLRCFGLAGVAVVIAVLSLSPPAAAADEASRLPDGADPYFLDKAKKCDAGRWLSCVTLADGYIKGWESVAKDPSKKMLTASDLRAASLPSLCGGRNRCRADLERAREILTPLCPKVYTDNVFGTEVRSTPACHRLGYLLRKDDVPDWVPDLKLSCEVLKKGCDAGGGRSCSFYRSDCTLPTE